MSVGRACVAEPLRIADDTEDAGDSEVEVGADDALPEAAEQALK